MTTYHWMASHHSPLSIIDNTTGPIPKGYTLAPDPLGHPRGRQPDGRRPSCCPGGHA
jgi:hypothetical protein